MYLFFFFLQARLANNPYTLDKSSLLEYETHFTVMVSSMQPSSMKTRRSPIGLFTCCMCCCGVLVKSRNADQLMGQLVGSGHLWWTIAHNQPSSGPWAWPNGIVLAHGLLATGWCASCISWVLHSSKKLWNLIFSLNELKRFMLVMSSSSACIIEEGNRLLVDVAPSKGPWRFLSFKAKITTSRQSFLFCKFDVSISSFLQLLDNWTLLSLISLQLLCVRARVYPVDSSSYPFFYSSLFLFVIFFLSSF